MFSGPFSDMSVVIHCHSMSDGGSEDMREMLSRWLKTRNRNNTWQLNTILRDNSQCHLEDEIEQWFVQELSVECIHSDGQLKRKWKSQRKKWWRKCNNGLPMW
jgi:hypothetical protein